MHSGHVRSFSIQSMMKQSERRLYRSNFYNYYNQYNHHNQPLNSINLVNSKNTQKFAII